jgi:hypothetical protein
MNQNVPHGYYLPEAYIRNRDMETLSCQLLKKKFSKSGESNDGQFDFLGSSAIR